MCPPLLAQDEKKGRLSLDLVQILSLTLLQNACLIQIMAAIATINECQLKPMTFHLRKVAGTLLKTQKAAHKLNTEIASKRGRSGNVFFESAKIEIENLPVF